MRALMLGSLLLLSLLSTQAAAIFPDCVFTDGFESVGTTNADAVAALVVHNCARKQVSPKATTPLVPLSWNSSIATTAQTYANQCHYMHSGTAGLGENIYASVSSGPDIGTMVDASFDWASEESSYNYASNTCSGVCGHYTQMVWDTTTQLGCGLKYCPAANTPFQPPFNIYQWTFVVCNYSPPGNDGSRPY